jgi:tRNA(fMet)-specific endonuclease VapC
VILYLLDTNIVSYYIRRSSSALEDRVSDALQRHNCAISTLTRAELRFGQAGMSANDKRHGLIDGFLLRLPNLDWTPQAADRYGEIKDHLKKQGTPVGEIDTQIAAHALAENLVLVTHNTKHFDRVPGLRLEDWML